MTQPADLGLARTESLGEGVGRMFSTLTGHALELLERPTGQSAEEAVHEARKRCKEARGLLRLVRPSLGESYNTTNGLLRDASRVLAPIRDPQALLGTFDDLVGAESVNISAVGALTVRSYLARRSSNATRSILGPERWRLDRAAALIMLSRQQAPHWKIPPGFEVVAAGVGRTYRRGRRRRFEALVSPDHEVFHQWRKRTKYLWYQIRMLEGSAPSILRPLASALHKLSDTLGDAHDLVVMTEGLSEAGEGIDPHERDAVIFMADTRRADLEDRALRLGARLYAEKPAVFVDRLEQYWKAWEEAAELRSGEMSDLFEPNDDLVGLGYRELYEMARRSGVPGRSAMRRHELERAVRAAALGGRSTAEQPERATAG